MLTSKSPRKVLLVAVAAGRAAFDDYSHAASPHKFTQPQLLACLVLKAFYDLDYRGVCELLADSPDLRAAIELKTVPHWTTLHKASRRLLKNDAVRRLIEDTVARIRPNKRLVSHAAADSSGFDARHASGYYVRRRDGNTADPDRSPKRVTYRTYGKLMLIVCCVTHAVLAAVASAGPTPDVHQLAGVLAELPRTVTVERLVADAGFDSAHNHKLLRDDHGIASTIPPNHGRPSKDPAALPADRWRRRMKTHFNHAAYRRRPQVETTFSMIKRNFGPALHGRSYQSRRRDLLLLAVTHNVALPHERVFYRAVVTPFLP